MIGAERRRHSLRAVSVLSFQLVVNLHRRFPQQKDVRQLIRMRSRPENVVSECRKERLREAHDPGNGEQQEDAHPHRAQQSDARARRLLLWGQPACQDRDENDVVYAKYDFEKGECDAARSARRLSGRRSMRYTLTCCLTELDDLALGPVAVVARSATASTNPQCPP